MGVAAMLAPKGLGPQDPTKKLAHRVELLGQPLSQKRVFENLGPEPPPPPLNLFFEHMYFYFFSFLYVLRASRDHHV